MLCKKCGAPVYDGEKFCKSCGVAQPKYRLMPALTALCRAIAYLFFYSAVQTACVAVAVFALMLGNPAALMTGDLRAAVPLIMEELSRGLHYILIISAALTILTLAVFFRARGKRLDEVCKIKPPSVGGIGRVCAVFALAAAAAVAAQLIIGIGFSYIYELFPGVRTYFDAFAESQTLMFGGSKLAELADIVLLTPILEEIIFRGLVFGSLRRDMPRWAAVLLSAAIFGVMHGSLIAFTYAFAVGLVFTLIYIRFDSLPVSIVMHMAFNGASYIPLPQNSGALTAVFAAAAVTAALTAAALIKIKRTAAEYTPYAE